MNPLELLRYLGQNVSVKNVPGETHPVLARSWPEEEDRRTQVCRDWNHAAQSPRAAPLQSAVEALPVREQTILSYALQAAMAARLQRPAGDGSNSGRDDQS